MTPEPPASSDGSPLPQRHRPSLGNLAKDTTEVDLWDFDEDLEMPGEDLESEEPSAPRSFSVNIPAPRGIQPGSPAATETLSSSNAEGEERIQMNISRRPLKKDEPGVERKSPLYESEFTDLENWHDPKTAPEIEELPAEVVPEPDAVVQSAPVIEEPLAPPAAAPAPVIEPPTPTTDDEREEFSPAQRENAAPPVSLRPHMGLSKIERIGLIALVVLLVGGGVTIFLSSLNHLPTEAVKAESADFPIKGDHVTVSSATSYWRAPIREGPDADTFRRGTELLPVVELAVSGGPATIRVFFRDEEGRTIGDAITRSVDSEGVLNVAATAGFDDSGMHAAYRTGESKPWTINVSEVTSGDSAGGKTKKLFEMNVSTDRR